MATQLKSIDFQPVVVPAAARPKLKVVFDTGIATQAVAAKLAELPPAIREATLEELAIGSAAEAVVATGRHELSRPMYMEFLRWGKAAAECMQEWEDEEKGKERGERAAEAVIAVADCYAITFEDRSFKAWVAGLEAGDCETFGRLEPQESVSGLVAVTLQGMARDLTQTSPLCRALDELAGLARNASPGRFEWAPTLAGIVADAFASAQGTTDVPPSAEMFTRGEVECIPTPFHRGLLVQWNEALGRYRAAVADSAACGVGDDPDNQLGAIESDALHRFLLTPAPSPAAHAIAARIYEETEAWELNAAANIARVFTSDARRFAKCGAFPQTDKPLLAAFETYRCGLREIDDLPGSASNADEEGVWAWMDPATEVVLNTRATTVEGVLAKLRCGFLAIGDERWRQDAVLDPGSAQLRDGIAMDGLNERILWSAIQDLARIAGVDLAKGVA